MTGPRDPGKRRRWRVWAAAITAVAVIATPLALQLRAESLVHSLCDQVGGLRVREAIPPDSVFAATSAAVFARGDPLARLAPGRLLDNIAVATWGEPGTPVQPCLESGVCTGILFTQSRTAYLHLAADGRSYLISALPSRFCQQGGAEAALPPDLIRIRDHQMSLVHRAPSICRASAEAVASSYLVSTPAVSLFDFNPLSHFVQFRAWRVFRTGRSDAAIEYNQFGVQTLGLKARWLFSQIVGVPDLDYSRNRCRADGSGRRPPVPLNADSHFDADSTFRVGRFVDPGAP